MFGSIWQGIVVTALVVSSFIIGASIRHPAPKVDKYVALLMAFEREIRSVDSRILTGYYTTSYYSNYYCPYENIVHKYPDLHLITTLTDDELEIISSIFQLRLKTYETDTIFNDVRKVAKDFGKYEECFATSKEVQTVFTALPLLKSDLVLINSIETSSMESFDEDTFHIHFLIALTKLSRLEMIRFTEIATTFKSKIDTLRKRFLEMHRNVTSETFQSFKSEQCRIISEMIADFKNELQQIQAKVKLSADFYKEVCPIGELDLDLKREIAYLVRRIAQDSQMIRDI